MRILALCSILVAGFWASACGGSDKTQSSASEAELEQAVSGAPKPLAQLYSKGNELVGGETDGFRDQLRELRGYPVVVNKWASWCGPCRHEFPFFQQQVMKKGKRVAFFGVDAEDGRAAARKFLDEVPVPYPSFFDPDNKISATFRATRFFPATAFYDKSGKLTYTKPGGYRDEAALATDIDRYAR